MTPAEIAKQVREWAKHIDSLEFPEPGLPITAAEMRAFADRLGGEKGVAIEATSKLSGYPSTCRCCEKNLKIGTKAFYVLLCQECDAKLRTPVLVGIIPEQGALGVAAVKAYMRQQGFCPQFGDDKCAKCPLFHVCRALAYIARGDAISSSPTLDSLLTSEEAKDALRLICLARERLIMDFGSLEPFFAECGNCTGNYTGFPARHPASRTLSEPPASAKLCLALYREA